MEESLRKKKSSNPPTKNSEFENATINGEPVTQYSADDESEYMKYMQEVDRQAEERNKANYHEPQLGVSHCAELSDGLKEDNTYSSKVSYNPDSIG